MTHRAPFITARAAWERPVFGGGRDELALLLTIAAKRTAMTPSSERPPVDVTFVLDRSGSMSGDKIELVKEAVSLAIDYLGPQDRIALVVFDDRIDTLQPLANATAPVRTAIRHTLRHVTARGSTNLGDGWLTGCRELAEAFPNPSRPRLQRAILLTDGQANIGITDSGELARHAANLRMRGISTTTMGVGFGFDEVLLGGMAEAGGGNFEYIARPGELPAFFEREMSSLVDVAALRPQVRLTLPPGLRATLLNMFPSSRAGKELNVDLRDLADGEEVRLVLLVTHHGRAGDMAHFTGSLRGIDPVTGEAVTVPLEILPLTKVSDAEAEAAPVDHAVIIARAHEQSLLDEREALRLDREGRYIESRRAFATSRDRLDAADRRAAASGYAGLSQTDVRALRKARALSMDFAAASQAPLGEHVHKERAAHRAAHSRGGRRG